MMMISRTFALLLALALVLVSAAMPLWAADVGKTPHQVVEATTQTVLKVITDGKQYFDKDPDRFYREVEGVLGPIVDFDGFSRSVMGRYGGPQYFRGLKTPEDKKRYVDQVKRFSDTFKNGLVRTYGKGLLTFEGQKIEVVPPRQGDIDRVKKGAAVDVTQLIHGSAETPYVVRYKMRLDSKSKEWKLRNVTIEDINVGQVYRSQFESSAKKNNGDLDKVIATWTVEPQEFSKEAFKKQKDKADSGKTDGGKAES
jgi:phospholipid transport system substrate-binding protein